MPDITLYFLQTSRSIRIAWLLEKLGLEYKLEAYDRDSTGLAPASLKQASGTTLGRAPVLKDGELMIQESGAITEYLCEQYDTQNILIPKDMAQRTKVREWIHAAEGTFMVHCLPTIYIARIDSVAAENLAPGLAENVSKDLDWLEAELKQGNGKFLVGEYVTAADIMVAFSIQYILHAGLGPKNKVWNSINVWLKHVEGQESYVRAVKRTGHHL